MNPSRTKLGLFAGTFDPIHEGHLAFAKAAVAQLSLDKVLLMPEPQPRGKQAVTALEHRIAMIELAIAGEVALECFVHNVPQFTLANTLPLVHEKFVAAELYILLGADVFAGVRGWPELINHQADVTFVVGRGAQALAKAAANLNVVYVQHLQDLQSSSKVRSATSSPLLPLAGYIAQHGLYASE